MGDETMFLALKAVYNGVLSTPWSHMSVTHPEPIWVTDNESLTNYCAQWLKLDAVALDTEFIRTDTFYPKPGLVQLGTADQVFLLDPLRIDNWTPFAEVLVNPDLVKVLHACGEDIEVFHILTGSKPEALFDTQVAAAFAGLGHSQGYQGLLKNLLDIDLPKDVTRSNWLQRPLTEAQISYASLDVVHLLEMYGLLLEKLEGSAKLEWLLEDCSTLSAGELYPEPEHLWQEVKRAWQLRPYQLTVLQVLCEFREREARRNNLPRNRVIPKGSLWSLARYMPDNTRSLSDIHDMRHSIIRQYGQQILNLIKDARDLPEEEHPQSLPAPLPKAAKEFGKLIRRFAGQQAEELDIPVELLMSGKLSTPILRGWLASGEFTLPDTVQGWRRDIFGKALVAYLIEQEQTH